MTSKPISLQMLSFYPKKAGSFLVGWLSARKLPRSMRGLIFGAFAGHYGIDVSEAEKELKEYESLQEFFTRRLKKGARHQEKAVPGFINCPVDGRIIAYGKVEQGTLIQAKGLSYKVSELLQFIPGTDRFEGGHYLTIYLSPRDYHRIHVPLEGVVTAVSRVEGELWPVNNESTASVEKLYIKNRRAIWIAKGTGNDDGLEVAVVLVGATHVGGVIISDRWLEGHELAKNCGLKINGLPCRSGEDLGTFQFGSTVVLLVGGRNSREWMPFVQQGPVKVGQRLGTF